MFLHQLDPFFSPVSDNCGHEAGTSHQFCAKYQKMWRFYPYKKSPLREENPTFGENYCSWCHFKWENGSTVCSMSPRTLCSIVIAYKIEISRN